MPFDVRGFPRGGFLYKNYTMAGRESGEQMLRALVRQNPNAGGQRNDCRVYSNLYPPALSEPLVLCANPKGWFAADLIAATQPLYSILHWHAETGDPGTVCGFCTPFCRRVHASEPYFLASYAPKIATRLRFVLWEWRRLFRFELAAAGKK